MERGPEDIDSFRELANSLSLQHRGNTDHSQYMKPSCQRMPPHTANENSSDNPSIEVDKMDGNDNMGKRTTDRRSQAKDDKLVVDTNITDRTTNGVPPSPTTGKKTANNVVKGNDNKPGQPLQPVRENLPPSNVQEQSDDLKCPKQERKGQKSAVVSSFSKESIALTQRRDSKASASGISQAKQEAKQKAALPAKFGNVAVFVCLAKVFFDSANFVSRCPTFILKPIEAESR